MNRDYPLKLIIEDNATIFCRDFLGLDIKSARPVANELKSRVRHADVLLELTLPDDSVELSHIELQSRGGALPMAKRMLDYFSIIGQQYHPIYPNIEDLPLRSYVIYLDKGTGKKDTGNYRLGKFHAGHFSYTVIRLWEMSAQALLDLQQPVLLTLIGQSKLENPQAEIQQALECINQVESKEKAGNLFALMGALIEDEELTTMVENYASHNEFFSRSPLLQKTHLRGWNEGMLEGEQKGKREGKREGKLEGLIEGKQKGINAGIIEAILETLSLRLEKNKLNLVMSQKFLEDMDREQLHTALSQAITVKNWEEFKDWLETTL